MLLTRILAVFVTLTALSMATAAAWDRGGTATDRMMLMAAALAIGLGAHLIPALTQRTLAWALWAACLLGTAYGHLTFFTHAGVRAGEMRSQHSAQVAGSKLQIEAAREAISEIKARPAARVASLLAITTDEARRNALETELAEAKRAAALRDALVVLIGDLTRAETAESANPVNARLARVTGSNEAGIELIVGVMSSILLELLGAMLWFQVLHPKDVANKLTDQPDALKLVKDAVSAGTCRPTVAGIRSFLGCGQAKAMELRRAI